MSGTADTGAYVYPWDVVGDPKAPQRLADLGLTRVTLAAAHHPVRAVSPLHPRRRITAVPYAAVYHPLDDRRWKGRRLRPRVYGDDLFGTAALALARAGLAVDAWVVLTHNSTVGAANPGAVVRNVYGDRYPWALCPSVPEVVEFARDLAAEAAARPGVAGVELEACGWYGFAHDSAHDRTFGVRFGPGDVALLSLCFCPACRTGYAAVGLEPEELRADVLAALGRVCQGARAGHADLVEALGPHVAEAVRDMRRRTAARLQAAVVEAVRAETGRPVLLHADPRPDAAAAFAVVDPAAAFRLADGLVVRCADLLDPGIDAPPGARLVAHVPFVVRPPAPRPDLPALLARARRAGATGFRFHHAGIATPPDLAALRDALLS